jgi:transcriptional regulator with XRE-family HTH domain
LTGRELRKIRLRLGLTQAQMTVRLDLDRRTIGRYERGERPVPRVVELAVRYLLSRR